MTLNLFLFICRLTRLEYDGLSTQWNVQCALARHGAQQDAEVVDGDAVSLATRPTDSHGAD